MSYGAKPHPDNDKDVLDALFSKVNNGDWFILENLINNRLSWDISPTEYQRFVTLLQQSECFETRPFGNFNKPSFQIKPECYHKIQKAGSYSRYLNSKPMTETQLMNKILTQLNTKRPYDCQTTEEISNATGINLNTVNVICKKIGDLGDCSYHPDCTTLIEHGVYTLSMGGYKESAQTPLIIDQSIKVTTHGKESPVAIGGSKIEKKKIEIVKTEDKKSVASFWDKGWVKGIVYPIILAFILWITNVLYTKYSKAKEPPLPQQEPKVQLK